MSVSIDIAQGGVFFRNPITSLKGDCTATQRGIFRVFVVRVPWGTGRTGLNGVSVNFLLGHDANNRDAVFGGSNPDHYIQIGGPKAGSGAGNAFQVRGQLTSTKLAWPATTNVGTMIRNVLGERRPYVCVEGCYFDGTSYKMFAGFSDGVNPAVMTTSTALSTAAGQWINSACAFQSQIFSNTASGSGLATSQPHYAVEHLAVFDANFPLSGTTPDSSWLDQLIQGTKTYNDLLTACGSGISGTKSILKWWPLINGDLSCSQTGEVLSTAGTVISDFGTIHPAWAHASGKLTVDPYQAGDYIQIWGGDGNLVPVITGKTGGATSFDVRVVSHTGAGTARTAVSGLDWQLASATVASGSYTITLPACPPPNPDGTYYDIEIRDHANTANVARMGKAVVIGLNAGAPGQSQADNLLNQGGVWPPTKAMLTATQHFYAVVLSDDTGGANLEGGTSSDYARTSAVIRRIQLGKDDDYAALTTMAAFWGQYRPNRPFTLWPYSYTGLGMVGDWDPELQAWSWAGLGGTSPTNRSSNYYLFGDNTNLTGFTAGSAGSRSSVAADGTTPIKTGIVTQIAILSLRIMDCEIFNWGGSDSFAMATEPGGVNAYEAAFQRRSSALRTVFFTRKFGKTLIPPIGRYNLGSSGSFLLRYEMHRLAAKDANCDFLCCVDDVINDGAASHHPRGGTAGAQTTGGIFGGTTNTGTAGSGSEYSNEGVQRIAARFIMGVVRWLDPMNTDIVGPRVLKAWKDPSSANVIWLETGAPISTISGYRGGGANPRVAQVSISTPTDGVTQANAATWNSATGATILASDGSAGNLDGSAGLIAEIDPSFPTRIKCTKTSGNWTGLEYVRIKHSEIFYSGSTYSEPDSGTAPTVKTMLDRCAYKRTSWDNDANPNSLTIPGGRTPQYPQGRGLMLQECWDDSFDPNGSGATTKSLGVGIALSTPPTANKFVLRKAEKWNPRTVSGAKVWVEDVNGNKLSADYFLPSNLVVT